MLIRIDTWYPNTPFWNIELFIHDTGILQDLVRIVWGAYRSFDGLFAADYRWVYMSMAQS